MAKLAQDALYAVHLNAMGDAYGRMLFDFLAVLIDPCSVAMFGTTTRYCLSSLA